MHSRAIEKITFRLTSEKIRGEEDLFRFIDGFREQARRRGMRVKAVILVDGKWVANAYAGVSMEDEEMRREFGVKIDSRLPRRYAHRSRERRPRRRRVASSPCRARAPDDPHEHAVAVRKPAT